MNSVADQQRMVGPLAPCLYPYVDMVLSHSLCFAHLPTELILFQDEGVWFYVKEYEKEDRTQSMSLNNYTEFFSTASTAANILGES